MTLVLMAAGSAAWLMAYTGWELAGAAHRRAEPSGDEAACGDRLGAPSRQDSGSVAP